MTQAEWVTMCSALAVLVIGGVFELRAMCARHRAGESAAPDWRVLAILLVMGFGIGLVLPFLSVDRTLGDALSADKGSKLRALNVSRFTLTCNPNTMTVFAEIETTNTLFDKDAKVQTDEQCTLRSTLLEVYRDREASGEASDATYIVRTRQPYEPKLVLDQVERVLTARYGSLQKSPGLAAALDQNALNRLRQEKASTVVFRCLDTAFHFDIADGTSHRTGTTPVACPATPAGDKPAQLRVMLDGTVEVFASQVVSADLANQLLAATKPETPGRQKSF